MLPSIPEHLLLVDVRRLPGTRQMVQEDNRNVSAAWAALLARAEDALDTPLLSVTQKAMTPPSGDRHDYLSMGPYWWPNPETPDGLPYIRRDGERNPEREQYDSPRLKTLAQACQALSWAYCFNGDTRFGEHAAALLRAWFLDPETRMNPHLEYGQFIPGVSEGRGIGIIDTSTVLLELLDVISVLSAGGALSAEEQVGLRAWMIDYRDWLVNSPKGIDESQQHNNHATWYDAQLAGLDIFTGGKEQAEEVCREARGKRIDSQIKPDGSQPHELARTRALSYATMNLKGFVNLATLGKQVGVDLWRYQSPKGGSLQAALDWLRPFAAGEKAWTHAQITPVEPGEWVELFRRAAIAYEEPRYEQVLDTLPDGAADAHLAQLLYPKREAFME